MARYIDLDDDEIIYCGNDGEYERYNIPTDTRTADVVERKKGEWLLNKESGIYECKNCGYVPSAEGFLYFNFCPNCGAEMRKGEKNEQKLV